jgi:ATP diphosphatase
MTNAYEHEQSPADAYREQMKSDPVGALLSIMTALRDPATGCPWDKKQTFETIAPYTIEEAYEVADAIARDDMIDLKDELGDLLFQSVYHAEIAREKNIFNFFDVVRTIAEKMLRRHPHVFGSLDATEADVKVNWEAIKAQERLEKRKAKQSLGTSDESKGLLDQVKAGKPVLKYALALQEKAATVGFDWDDAKFVFAKIEEEIQELRFELEQGTALSRHEDEIGDILFAVVNLARHLNVDPERALQSTNEKFKSRFSYIEQKLKSRGQTLEKTTLEEMEALWQEAKA